MNLPKTAMRERERERERKDAHKFAKDFAERERGRCTFPLESEGVFYIVVSRYYIIIMFIL
jgi:hypothetical protein